MNITLLFTIFGDKTYIYANKLIFEDKKLLSCGEIFL